MLGLARELTAEQRLQKNVVNCIKEPRYAALASIISIGTKTVDDNIPTACTDGVNELYGRTWIEAHSDPEIRFGIIHESKHKMYKHSKLLQPLWKMDAMTANMAADFVINLEIMDENPDGFCVMPEGCLLDEQYRGMDPTEVFWLLYDAKDGEDEDEGDEEGEGGEGRPCPWDDHDWKEGKFTNKEMREIDREIDRAIRQGSITASKLGGAGVSRDISGLLRPQVNWREVLRQFIQNQFKGSDYSTYARPNRRYIGAGIYMPSGVSEHMGVLVNANDTSGSVGDPELRVIKTEVVELTQAIKPEELHVIYWDHAIQRHEIYQPEELDGLEHKTKPEGGGGTNPEIVPPYMKEKNINAQCAVVVTDGVIFGDWGDWDCPVLWVIIDNESAVPPHGEILHVKSSQLRSF
jgi:predicted metal-dependent peptidase